MSRPEPFGVNILLNSYVCRLSKAPTIVNAVNERQLMALYGVDEKQLTDEFDATTVGSVDKVSVDILDRFHSVMLHNYTPLLTVGDGNCAYRAVSLALFGTEGLHDYVRLITALEIIENPHHYDMQSPTYCGAFNDSRVLSSTYGELVDAVVQPGHYASLMHLYGISAAVCCTVQSYIPPTASVGLDTSPYTVRIVGRNVRAQQAARLTLMWTMTRIPRRNQPYEACHFALLAPRSCSSVTG